MFVDESAVIDSFYRMSPNYYGKSEFCAKAVKRIVTLGRCDSPSEDHFMPHVPPYVLTEAVSKRPVNVYAKGIRFWLG